MKLSDFLEKEIRDYETNNELMEKHIYDIRNGLDLEKGETRDDFTVNTLVQSKKDKVKFNLGAIKALKDVLKLVAK